MMSSGSGGSHGLCGSGRPVAVCAAPIAETRVARSVGIVASFPTSGGFVSRRESSSKVSQSPHQHWWSHSHQPTQQASWPKMQSSRYRRPQCSAWERPTVPRPVGRATRQSQ